MLRFFGFVISEFFRLVERLTRAYVRTYLKKYLEEFFEIPRLCCELKDWKINCKTAGVTSTKFQSLNEYCEKHNLPFTFKDVHIESASVTVPFALVRTLSGQNGLIEISGVTVVVQLKQCKNDSGFSSMSTSFQLTEEVSDTENESCKSGFQKYERSLRAALASTQARVTDLTVRIETVSETSETVIGIEFHFDSIDCHGADDIQNFSSQLEHFLLRFSFVGVSLSTTQFPAKPQHLCYQDAEHMNEGDLEDSEPVLISKILGRQSLHLKIKQDESTVRPKLDVKTNISVPVLFLSPQQVLLLLELVNKLRTAYTSVTATDKTPTSILNESTKVGDFAFVEQDKYPVFQSPRQSTGSDEGPHFMPKGIPASAPESADLVSSDSGKSKPWSNGSSQYWPNSEDQRSLKSRGSSQYRSSEDQKSTKSRGSLHSLLYDPLSESSQFHATCKSLCIILLHEDSSQTVDTDKISSRASKRAEKFFNDLSVLVMSGPDFQNFADMRVPLSSLCQLDHLRIMASTITFEKTGKSSFFQNIRNVSITSSDLEILECLFTKDSQNVTNLEPNFTELFAFKKKEPRRCANTAEKNEPRVTVNYHRVECTSEARGLKLPDNRITVHVEPFTCEVDLSIIDRAQLLNQHRECLRKEKSQEISHCWEEDDSTTSPKCEITAKVPCIEINIRFPKHDLCQSHSEESSPSDGFMHKIHNEILRLELSDVSYSTTFENLRKAEVQCRDFVGLFLASPTCKPVTLLQVSVEKWFHEDEFDWPRLVFCEVLHNTPSVFDTDDVPDEELSPFTAVNFSGPRSSTSNDDANFSAGSNETMPAAKEAMDEFIAKTVGKSKYSMEFFLPTVSLWLPVKHLFHLLCSRLKELLKWKPRSTHHTHDLVPDSQFTLHSEVEWEAFQTFLSTVTETNDCSEDDSESCSSQEPVSEQKLEATQFQSSLTKISVTVKIQKGVIIHNPLRQDSAQNVQLAQCGKMQLEVEGCIFFGAFSYCDEADNLYMCFRSNKAAFSHNGSMGTQPPADAEGTLQAVMYLSERGDVPLGAGVSVGTGGSSLDMLSLSMHIRKDSQEDTKVCKIAVALKSATFLHRVGASEAIITQLIDFLSVTNSVNDDAAPPSPIIMEVHLNLQDCAVDYSPLSLPFRAVIMIENCSLSQSLDKTNEVSSNAHAMILKVVSEQLCLFIAPVDRRRNFVCVVETGWIEAIYRDKSGNGQANPRREVIACNDGIHIRTCVDSCSALQSILMCFVNSVDFCPTSSDSKGPVLHSEPVKATLNTDIESLMAEAVVKCPAAVDALPVSKSGVRGCPEFTVINLGADDFVFLDAKPEKEPQVKMLISGPICPEENHFATSHIDSLEDPVIHFSIKSMSAVWHLYGGRDFKRENSTEGSKIGDGYLEDCAFTDYLSLKARGGIHRERDVLMELQLTEAQFRYMKYGGDSELRTQHVLKIKDIVIQDKLAVSGIHKFLHWFACEAQPRQTDVNMLVVKVTHIQPNDSPDAECSLWVSCQPIRLNIDQDSLMFLCRFFKELFEMIEEKNIPGLEGVQEQLTFFRPVKFTRDVLVRLDYHGKRLVFEQGLLNAALMCLIEFNGAELRLKRIFYRRGLLGLKKVIAHALRVWQNDIQANQLPNLLGGLGHMNSLIRLFCGVTDLFVKPVEQYQKDGNIIRGLKKGAASFCSSTPAAVLDLASGVMKQIQNTASLSYDIVTPGPSVSQQLDCEQNLRQPAGVREGVETAYNILKEGLSDTANSFVDRTTKEHELKGVVGAVGGVLRQLPASLLKPLVIGAKASCVVLEGAKNEIDPDAYNEAVDKWKTVN